MIDKIEETRAKFKVDLCELPQYIEKEVNWLFSGEINIAKEIILKQEEAFATLEYNNAIASINGFIEKCNELFKNGQMYSPVEIHISAPGISINFSIEPEKKTFFQKVKNFLFKE